MVTGAASGWVKVIGLGPGDEACVTPDARAALDAASDIVGYGPYVSRVALRSGQTAHATDNRVERDRAAHALDMAASGKRVAVVSSGDAGVFAMAATVYEVLEEDLDRWATVDVHVIPGLTAMTAVAARVGAPLGHDFCAISLSDNLKPWDLILKRVALAAEGDFVMSFYNPIAKARPWQLGEVFTKLRALLPSETPVVFATAVSRADERVEVVSLKDAAPEMADMRTLVMVGSRNTRVVTRPDGTRFVYTPRKVAAQDLEEAS